MTNQPSPEEVAKAQEWLRDHAGRSIIVRRTLHEKLAVMLASYAAEQGREQRQREIATQTLVLTNAQVQANKLEAAESRLTSLREGLRDFIPLIGAATLAALEDSGLSDKATALANARDKGRTLLAEKKES